LLLSGFRLLMNVSAAGARVRVSADVRVTIGSAGSRPAHPASRATIEIDVIDRARMDAY
jgi:hypothetical protein